MSAGRLKPIYSWGIQDQDFIIRRCISHQNDWLSRDSSKQETFCREASNKIQKALNAQEGELSFSFVVDQCWMKCTGAARLANAVLRLDFIFLRGDVPVLAKLIFERIDGQASSGALYPAHKMQGVLTDAAWDGAIVAALYHAEQNGFPIPKTSDLRWRVDLNKAPAANENLRITGRSAGVTFLLALYHHFGKVAEWNTRQAFESIISLAALPTCDQAEQALIHLGGHESKKALALQGLGAGSQNLHVVLAGSFAGFQNIELPPSVKISHAETVEQLKSAIQEIIRRERMSALEKPQALDFDYYLQIKRKGFVGREWLFEEMDLWHSTSKECALLITGDLGSGKTSLVAELIHRNPGGRVIGYHFCQSNEIETLRPGRFVQSLAAMIASCLPAYAKLINGEHLIRVLGDERCEKDPGGAFLEGILQPLQKIPAPDDGIRYILVDALDEALFTSGEKCIVDILHKNRLDLFPGWLRLVVTARNDSRVLQRLGTQRAKHINLSDVRYQGDVMAFLHWRINEDWLAKHSSTFQISADAVVKQIAKNSCANFLYAVKVLEAAHNNPDFLGNLNDLPAGLNEYYLDCFQKAFRHGNSREYRQIREILEVLCAAKEPLSISTLANIRMIEEPMLRHQLDESLSQFIHRRQQSGGREIVEIFHKSFIDWLIDPSSAHAFGISRHNGEKALASFCRKAFEQGIIDLDSYVRRNALAHFLHLKQHNIAIKKLSDVCFIDAKAKSLEITDLLRDYEAANIPSLQPYRLFVASNRLRLHKNAIHPGFTQNLAFLQGLPNVQPFRHVKNSDGQRIEISKTVTLSKAAGKLPSLYLEEHENPVTQLAISSEMLVSCDIVGKAIVWNYGWKRPVELTSKGKYTCASIHPQTSRIAVGRSDGIIELSGFDRIQWLSPELRPLANLGAEGKPVSAMAFMNDGQFLVASDSDGILTFWNVRTRQQKVVNTRGAVNVISAVGENLVLVGYSDGILRVFDSSGELKNELPGEVGEIHSITMMQDGSLVLFGDLGIRRTNPNGIESYMRSLGSQYQKNERSNYCKTAANANCGLAVHTNSSGNIILRSLSTGDSIALLVGQISPIISLALSDDGYAVAGTQNGSLCVWNLKMLVADNLLEKHDPKRDLMAQRDRSSDARSYDKERPQNWEAGFQWYSGKKMHEGSHEFDQDSQDDVFSVERINFNPLFECVTVTKSGGQAESFDVDGRQILPDFSNSGSLQYESFYRQEAGLKTSSLKSGLTVSWDSDSLGGGFIKVNHAILNSCLHSHFYPAERLYFVSLSDNGQNFAIADHEGYFSILNSQSGEILFRLFLRNLSSIAFIWGNSMIAAGYGTGKSEIIYLSGL